jgi:hypothetical protein
MVMQKAASASPMVVSNNIISISESVTWELTIEEVSRIISVRKRKDHRQAVTNCS